jgi:PAS domain S-box-containing protein
MPDEKCEPLSTHAADVLQESPDALFWADRDGRLIDVSPAFTRLTGYERGDLIGTPLSHITAAEAAEAEGRLLRAVADTGVAAEYDKEYLHRSGDRIPTWVSAFAVRHDGTGAVVGIARRTAGRRGGEQALRHIQRIESLRVLARGVAHDFNNVLGTVVGHLTLAVQAVPENARARELVGRAQVAIKRAGALVEQLLLYSGSGEYRAETTDLGLLLMELRPALEAVVSGRGRLVYDLAPDLPPVPADRSLVQQLLENLVTNASEAMPAAGTVTVRTRSVDVSRESRSRWSRTGTLLPEGAYVSLEVEDDGSGMSPEVLARAFDPFYGTKFVGRGLGLALALGVARAHRGGIDAESEPGRGTRLTVLLPVAGVPTAAPRPTPPRASGTILVVEDEADIRDFAEYVLEANGFHVLSAADGLAALELIAAHKGDVRLVLLDLSMPRLDGRETLRRLRTIDPEVPVLLTSGYSTGDATAGFGPGDLVGFLHKPYDDGVLLAKIREILG